MDRPSGPLGAATQSTGRGMLENSTQPVTIRRPVGAPPNSIPSSAVNGSVPPVPPIPKIRNVPSNPSLSGPIVASAPTPAAKVIALAREAMQNALQENEAQAQRAEGGAANTELKPGVTINLSHKGIRELPEEVVDVIKNELERLALSHNQLTSFPARFSECNSLRYLNVRNNQIKDFPLPLCDLKSLEILDLGRNKLRILPPELIKLTSLKVLSVQRNRIQELPLFLADMASLHILKLDGNEITFPPPEVFQVPIASPPNEGVLRESEMAELAVTAQIKKYLRQRTLNGRAESDVGGDESSEGTETPRLPIKRVASGRFPVKVNGSEMPDLRSPATVRPPPIPTRSHYRGLSQQSTTMRRTNVMPLTIGSVNERVRSNSETGVQQTRQERPESRSRRMGGVLSKKGSDLGTLDEMQVNNRFSHYRGLSHGSAMQGPGVVNMADKSPASPAEPYMQRPIYVRRLSILPERRRESKIYDPMIETAKGILYSVFQIHPMIQMLMSLTNDGSAKRSSLEFVFYNTNSHVEELEQAIQKHDPLNGEDESSAHHDNENVLRACQTLVSAYTHVCTLLAGNIDIFVDNGDPRYIRTLLVLLYNSIMELRVTMSSLSGENGGYYRQQPNAQSGMGGDTIRPHSREPSTNPIADRAGPPGPRPRNGGFVPNPSNLRVATDVAMAIPYTNGAARAAAPLESATPRSGESFASGSSASVGRNMDDFTDEDRLFEKIFLSLQRSSELVMRSLPGLIAQLTGGLRNAIMQRERNGISDEVIRAWKLMVAKATTAVHQTETLKARMSLIKLKEPGIRTQTAFWNVCSNFLRSWSDFGAAMKFAVGQYNLPIGSDARARLRPIHQAIKETTEAIRRSPWAYILRESTVGPLAMNPLSPQAEPGHNNGMQMQMPMTPQSAALGPAVQATVPSTPQSASFSSAFAGNVFERADALISYGGLSIPSRAGTMTTTNSSFGGGSLGSNSMHFHDGAMTPATIVSPGSSISSSRLNGGRVAF